MQYIGRLSDAGYKIEEIVRPKIERIPDVELTNLRPRVTSDSRGRDIILFECDIRWYSRAYSKAKGSAKAKMEYDLREHILDLIVAAADSFDHPLFYADLELCINNY
ncbi:MAG: hypothetical protein K6E59_00340 [Bacilli bacterium]|nr:hypothetical protein [Bacilli bacterium]